MNLRQLLKNTFAGLTPDSSDKHLSHSEVFCMAPWMQLHVTTQGEITPCCISAYKGGAVGNLRENSNLQDAWNSEKMKRLRLNMLQGKKNSICSNCYEYERLGKFGDRKQYNRDYKSYYNKVKYTLTDGTVQDLNIPILDIRFSNKCNYKCRICNSGNSSLLYEEDLKLGKIGSDTPKKMNAAGNETIFWESYKRLLPGARRLNFAGGEPLLMDEHYRALEYLISIGNTDITLSYNTNLSNLRYKKYNVIDLWNKFRKVDVWASLDGMAEKGDYQRKGQRWKDIEENIRTLQANATTVFFGIDVTVSVFNILHLPEFYEYMVENKLVAPDRMNLYYLNDPDYFNVTNLTPQLKRIAIELYRSFNSDYLQRVPDSERIREHSAALIKYMLSEDLKKQQEFQTHITEVDELRKEKFTNTFPELSEMMLNNRPLS